MSESIFDLSGRTALVTGGTRGIGRALADGLEAAGARVIVHGRSPEAPASVTRRYVGADLARSDGARALADAVGDLDRLDILVNNAGYEAEEDSFDLSPDEWVRTFNVNTHAPAALVGALRAQLMASGHASVINITSIHEAFPFPRHLAYASSKAALSMVTKALAVDVAKAGIRVNAIAPGVIETDINRHTIARVGRASFEAAIPMGRLGRPDDVAGAVVFLASDASSYITGTTVFVDGAYSLNISRT